MKKKIDKSALRFGEPKRIRDRAWLRALAKNCKCAACEADDDTIIAAHIRWGSAGGTGLKPSDDLVVPLCHKCHIDQEANPGPEWWAECMKSAARRAYRAWKDT